MRHIDITITAVIHPLAPNTQDDTGNLTSIINSTYNNRENEPLSIHCALGEQLSFSVPL